MNDLEKALAYSKTENWIFAKTMAEIPHWYCIKNKVRDKGAYEEFAATMETHGEIGFFGKRRFKYFHLNGYKYWHCGELGWDSREVDLINRDKYKKTIDKTPYFQQGMFDLLDRDETHDKILSYIGDRINGRVLDIRCGDCSFKNTAGIGNYTGIDNRHSYLLMAKKENPDITVYLDSVKNLYLGKYDLIISLLGEGSLLTDYDVDRMLHMMHEDTKVFLMYHRHKPCNNERLLKTMKSEMFLNYQIITNI